MKKLVFFADVHGNITGLREVINEINKLTDVTHIVGLGDFFGYSAGHNEIIDLCAQNNVIMIRGNHEEMYKEIDEGKFKPIAFQDDEQTKTYNWVLKMHDWLRSNLINDYYHHIKSLPMAFKLRLNDQYSLVSFHAALDDTKSRTCSPYLSSRELEARYGSLPESIIVYGHYHEPHVLPLNGKLLINCASVGMRKDNCLSNYTIIEYDDEKVAVIQRQVPYDKNEEDELVIKRGMIRAF